MSTINRKCSLRDSYARKMRQEGRYTTFEKRTRAGYTHWIEKKKKPLKKQSRRQKDRLREYFPIRNEFLARPENQACAACLCRDQRPSPSSEVHHSRSRNGPLLFDTRFFIATCGPCGRWIHDHPREARELGLLASANEWGVAPPPGDG